MWAKAVELLLMSYLQPMQIQRQSNASATPVCMYFTALLLLIYVFMRAMNLSMTHDEAMPILLFMMSLSGLVFGLPPAGKCQQPFAKYPANAKVR